MDRPVRARRGLDGVRPRGPDHPRRAPGGRRPAASPAEHLETQPRARASPRTCAVAATQVGLDITLLAHQAVLMTDAIVRTLVRLAITRRNLLEWTTASQTKRSLDLGLPGFYRRMAGGVLIAAATGLLVVLLKPSAIPVAAAVRRALAALAGRRPLGQHAAPRRAGAPAVDDRRPRASGSSAGGRGGSSRSSWDRRTMRFPRTTSRRSPRRSSPTARRRRTSACTCWRS